MAFFYPSCLEKGMHSELGVSVELSEAEVHWRKFLESLIATALLIELDEKRLANGKVYLKG